jgi:polyhydroxybutyrate depolymerase
MAFRTLLPVLFTCFVLQSFSQARPFKFGEERRRYLLYLPKSYERNQAKKYPLIFNFHGGGMTMAEQMFYSGMNKAADQHDFIVVYPQGVDQDWNVGFETSYRFGTDDVGYIEQLLQLLVKQYRVDETAIYATGLSRGGFFCHRLATELPERFAAIATVGGLLPDSVASFHAKQVPVSVLLIHGTSDGVVNINGKPGAYRSATATFQYWTKHNGLESAQVNEAKIDKVPSDSTAINVFEAKGNGKAVCLVTITGGGILGQGQILLISGFPWG